jgi:hypothetical protein
MNTNPELAVLIILAVGAFGYMALKLLAQIGVELYGAVAWLFG